MENTFLSPFLQLAEHGNKKVFIYTSTFLCMTIAVRIPTVETNALLIIFFFFVHLLLTD